MNHKSMPEITDEQIKEEVMKLHQAVYEKFGLLAIRGKIRNLLSCPLDEGLET